MGNHFQACASDLFMWQIWSIFFKKKKTYGWVYPSCSLMWLLPLTRNQLPNQCCRSFPSSLLILNGDLLFNISTLVTLFFLVPTLWFIYCTNISYFHILYAVLPCGTAGMLVQSCTLYFIYANHILSSIEQEKKVLIYFLTYSKCPARLLCIL